MSAVEVPLAGQDAYGTVMQCTEGSDDLQNYHKLFSPNRHRRAMFRSSEPAYGAIAGMVPVPVELYSDENETADNHVLQSSIYQLDGYDETDAVLSRKVYPTVPSTTSSDSNLSIDTAVFSASTASQDEPVKHLEDNQQVNGKRNSMDHVVCLKPSGHKRTQRTFLGQCCRTKKRTSKSTKALSKQSYIHKTHGRTSAFHKGTHGGQHQFEMDNLLFQNPKDQSSLSSSLSSLSFECVPEYIIQKAQFNRLKYGNKLDEQQKFMPKDQSSFSNSSLEVSHLESGDEASQSSNDNDTIWPNMSDSSGIANSSRDRLFIKSDSRLQHKPQHVNGASACFNSGVPRNHSVKDKGHRESVDEQSTVFTSNQFKALQTLHEGLIQAKKRKDLLEYSPNIPVSHEASDDIESVQETSWIRRKADPIPQKSIEPEDRNQLSDQREAVLGIKTTCAYGNKHTGEGMSGHSGKKYFGTKYNRVSSKQNIASVGTGEVGDVIESFSTNSYSSGFENGSSEENLRARCIAPGCLNNCMSKQFRLCIECYRFLRTKNNSSDENESLFAINPHLCKAPHCNSPGSKSNNGLCESCCLKLNLFVSEKNGKKLQHIHSDPSKITHHIRQDPHMPWAEYYNTTLQK